MKASGDWTWRNFTRRFEPAFAMMKPVAKAGLPDLNSVPGTFGSLSL
jgi:hypothetical protein